MKMLKTKKKPKKISISHPNKKVATTSEVAKIIKCRARDVARRAPSYGMKYIRPVLVNSRWTNLYSVPEKYHRLTDFKTYYTNSGGGFYLFVSDEGFWTFPAIKVFCFSLQVNGFVISRAHRLGLTDIEIREFISSNKSLCHSYEGVTDIDRDLNESALRCTLKLLIEAGLVGSIFSMVDFRLRAPLRNTIIARLARYTDEWTKYKANQIDNQSEKGRS